MNPIDEERARVWSTRFRWLYLFVAWNAFIFGYKYYKDNKDKFKEMGFIEDETSAHRKARLMELGNMTIFRVGANGNVATYKFDDQYVKEYAEKIEMQDSSISTN